MRTYILSLIVSALISYHAIAVPITSGSLSSLINLGSTGGTIGSTLFSDFAILPGQTGSNPISPDNILVNPIDEINNPGLQFVLNQTANANQLFEMRISYRVSDASIFGASVSLSGSSVDPDGVNSALLSLVEPSQSLIAFDIGLLSESPVTTSFNPLTALNVESDVVIDGGLAGRAILASVSNQFNVVGANAIPEPTSILIAFGLFGTLLSRHFGIRQSA